MATVFSGGTYVDTTLSSTTKTLLIGDIQTKLTTAGWTVVSGSGTTNLLVQTAADANSNQGRVRFKDNGGNCVQVTIENISGSKVQSQSTSVGGNLLPNATSSFHILASKYRFEIFQPGTPTSRDFVCAGIINFPAVYAGVITEAIYMSADSANDGDGTNRNSFRSNLSCSISGNTGNHAGICNGSIYQLNNNYNTGTQAGLRLRVPSSGIVRYFNQTARWHDLALDTSDPLVCWGLSTDTDEGLIRGQMYDWTVLSDYFAADTLDTWVDGGSSHDWWALTNNNTGLENSNVGWVKGTIWVARN